MPQQAFTAQQPDALQGLLEAEANDDLQPDAIEYLAQQRASNPKFPKRRAAAIPQPPTAGQTALNYAPDIGQAAGSTIGGLTGLPGASAMGGVGGRVAGRYVQEAVGQHKLIPDVPASSYLGEAGVGALGEGVGKVLSLPFGAKRPMTKLGQQTYDTLGDKAMIPDLVDSGLWDFGRNVANESFFGKTAMKQREQQTGEALLGKVNEQAQRKFQQAGAPAGVLNDKSTGGLTAQSALRDNYMQATQDAKSLYKDFLAQHGNTPIKVEETPAAGGIKTDEHGGLYAEIAAAAGEEVPKPKPLTFGQLHEQQSAALSAARDAHAANDMQGQMQAMAQVHKIRDKMAEAVPSDVWDKYSSLSSDYQKVMEQYDNPIVHNLREKRTAEEFIDTILNPSKLGTFTPFKAIEGVTERGMPTHQAVSQEDAVHLVRMALGESKFRQLQADSIFALGQNAVKEAPNGSEMLDGKSLVGQLKKMPENVRQAFFGPAQARNLDIIADVTQHVQRARTGSGGLWIVMRQPSVALGAAAGIAGGGWLTGKDNTGLALTTAGTVLLGPKAFQMILTNPKATKLFVQTIATETPGIRATLLKQLTAQLAKASVSTATSHGLKAVLMPPKPEPSMSGATGFIPQPPR